MPPVALVRFPCTYRIVAADQPFRPTQFPEIGRRPVEGAERLRAGSSAKSARPNSPICARIAELQAQPPSASSPSKSPTATPACRRCKIAGTGCAQVITERAASTWRKIPGGSTGILCKDYKGRDDLRPVTKIDSGAGGRDFTVRSKAGDHRRPPVLIQASTVVWTVFQKSTLTWHSVMLESSSAQSGVFSKARRSRWHRRSRAVQRTRRASRRAGPRLSTIGIDIGFPPG
jgi:hypothetical protein